MPNNEHFGHIHIDEVRAAARLIGTDPELADFGELSVNGLVWVLSCDNTQTHRLVRAIGTIGSKIVAPGGPATLFWLSAALGYIEFVNFVGGFNGVEINGVMGAHGVIVTPRGGALFQELVKVGRLAVSGRTIMDFIVRASAQVPALGQALGIPVVAAAFSQVAAGTPLGWAIAAGLGLAVNLLQPEPDPNAHGAVLADRDRALEWESFLLGHLGDGNKVALLSWQGFFSAQLGGGHGVYANRPVVGPWETWTLLDNGDGTVSLQTINGHYLCAEEGGGRECQANRTAIGAWEKFILVPLPGGKVALRTRQGGKYVSVQRDS